MPFPHYGMWNVFNVNPPDFHRPEYFGEIIPDLPHEPQAR
ncbi:MAG: carbohydrate-binding family 9-like protein [Fusicatenibacter sp.]